MATAPEKPKLIAIVGPTASGKTELALHLAHLVPAEIVSADSRTIYRGMDIGTAKPTFLQRHEIPHWGLDLLDPGQNYSVKEFQAYAGRKIDEINTRGKLAIMVGGTGLYVDSVLYDFAFTSPASERRGFLETRSVDELQKLVLKEGLTLPVNDKNKRHLIRTLERGGLQGTRHSLRPSSRVIGLLPGDEELRANISKRAEAIFSGGIIQETESLIDKYGRAAIENTGGIVYKICIQVLDGDINEQTATTLFKTADWQYARRQKTWFKKNNDIIWFTEVKTALAYLKTQLNT